MAVIDLLPNGHILVTLTPREAVMLGDNILDPDAFPWQSSESQMVSVEVKMGLRNALDALHRGQIDMITQRVMHNITAANMTCPNEECDFYQTALTLTPNGRCPNCQRPLITMESMQEGGS